MLLPTVCPLCGRHGDAPCAECAVTLRPAPGAPAPSGLQWCGALLAYEGAARRLITAAKYQNDRACLAWLAAGMAMLCPVVEFDLVTWAPTSRQRRESRGYDQAELLARHVARRLGRPCKALLKRCRGPAQTGRSRAQRLDGPEFACLPLIKSVEGGRVLVVDDVVTSGATLGAAAHALRQAHVPLLWAVAAARTPSFRNLATVGLRDVYHPSTSPQAGG